MMYSVSDTNDVIPLLAQTQKTSSCQGLTIEYWVNAKVLSNMMTSLPGHARSDLIALAMTLIIPDFPQNLPLPPIWVVVERPGRGRTSPAKVGDPAYVGRNRAINKPNKQTNSLPI